MHRKRTWADGEVQFRMTHLVLKLAPHKGMYAMALSASAVMRMRTPFSFTYYYVRGRSERPYTRVAMRTLLSSSGCVRGRPERPYTSVPTTGKHRKPPRTEKAERCLLAGPPWGDHKYASQGEKNNQRAAHATPPCLLCADHGWVRFPKLWRRGMGTTAVFRQP